MTTVGPIIEMGGWLKTPPGTHLLAWEQRQLDAAVADAFGFHALQLGMPQLQALRANRMPHRWVALEEPQAVEDMPPVVDLDPALSTQLPVDTAALHCDFDALPFPSHSLDLTVLPHTLERSRDPHLTLREVERVLVPEGRLLLTGFNPASLWGARQRMGHALRQLGLLRNQPLYLPRGGEFINYWRLRDWLRLLSFEVESAQFGIFQPAVHTQAWLQRWAAVERLGAQWWPVFGAVYVIVAVKRVRGMRLVGLARREARVSSPAPAVAATPRQTAQHQRGGDAR